MILSTLVRAENAALELNSPLERKIMSNWLLADVSEEPWRSSRRPLRWLAERPVVARVRWREDVLSTSSSHASCIFLLFIFCFFWIEILFLSSQSLLPQSVFVFIWSDFIWNRLKTVVESEKENQFRKKNKQKNILKLVLEEEKLFY